MDGLSSCDKSDRKGEAFVEETVVSRVITYDADLEAQPSSEDT